MNNVFFTGLSGFLGQEFLKYYNSKKNNNFCFIQNPFNYKGCGKNYNYTFLSKDFSEKIDILVHAGAFTPKTREQMEDVTLNLSNVINTDYLLKNLPNIPKKIIYISTVSVYSPTKNVINEETPLGGDSVYGLSKLMCEKIIQNYCIQNKIPYQILRLSVVYGNNHKVQGLIPTFIKNICQNKSIMIYNDGLQKKNFINVYDVARVIYKSITESVIYPVINVVGNESISVKEVAEILIKCSGKNIKIENYNNDQTNDIIFDTSLMTEVFGKNKISYTDGLKQSYIDLSEVYCESM